MTITSTRRPGQALLGAALWVTAFTASAANACSELTAAAQDRPYSTATLAAADGVCLRVFAWKPAPLQVTQVTQATQVTQVTQVRAVVVITHGIRDYALRYGSLVKQLTAQGIAVYAQDLRGHAHSGGDRQRFDSMAQLVADADLVVSKAAQENPAAPLFVFGHSLGGLVTTEYALAHTAKVKGVILSGAALKLPLSVSSFSVGIAQLIAKIAPGLPIQKIDDSEFSRDKDVMAALAIDPLISHDKLPAVSVSAAIAGINDVNRSMETFKLPMLLLHGTADKVNPIEGSRELAQRASSADKTLKTYDGLYHDLLHEPEHAKVERDIVEWLNARLR